MLRSIRDFFSDALFLLILHYSIIRLMNIDMPINQIVQFCRNLYQRNGKCTNCPNTCSNCNMCLQEIHNDQSNMRTYDCNNMIFCYVCSYINNCFRRRHRSKGVPSLIPPSRSRRGRRTGLAKHTMFHGTRCRLPGAAPPAAGRPARRLRLPRQSGYCRLHSPHRRKAVPGG